MKGALSLLAFSVSITCVGAPVVGTVLNDISSNTGGYYGGYYYYHKAYKDKE